MLANLNHATRIVSGRALPPEYPRSMHFRGPITLHRTKIQQLQQMPESAIVTPLGFTLPRRLIALANKETSLSLKRVPAYTTTRQHVCPNHYNPHVIWKTRIAQMT
jgi:hypothetical protein